MLRAKANASLIQYVCATFCACPHFFTLLSPVSLLFYVGNRRYLNLCGCKGTTFFLNTQVFLLKKRIIVGFIRCAGYYPAASFFSFSSTILTNTGNIPYTTFCVRPSFKNASQPPLNCAFHRARNSAYLG